MFAKYPNQNLFMECYIINVSYEIFSKYQKPKRDLFVSMWCDFYDKFMIWHVQNRSSVQYQRQFQLDRFLLKLFGKAILGIKRSISKEIWAKIEWMIIEFQSICELLTWFLLPVKCNRKKKEKMDRDRNIESHLPLREGNILELPARSEIQR